MHEELSRALNRVAKWRSIFAGWQLGTRTIGDPECDAVRDHREGSILLRVEMNALTGLLLKKGLMNEAEWSHALLAEADQYNLDLEKRFPGARATDHGISLGKEAAEWMKNWRP